MAPSKAQRSGFARKKKKEGADLNFLQGKNGMERASFDAVWPHLPCLPSPKEGALGKNLKKGPCIREGSMDLDIK